MRLVLAVLWLLPALAFADPAPGAIVDRWLAAQNAGKLDDYAALYGKHFHGIRRSGDKTIRFDRDGWMRDRKKMFDHPMKVAIDRRTIDTTGGRTRVRFTQTFEQGSYKDAGEKELVIEGGKIIREEMLASVMAGADGSVCEHLRCAKTSTPAAIVTTCEAACTAGTASACWEAAVMYDLGECHVAKDPAKARAFYTSACGPDDAMACAYAADAQPPAQAAPLLAKGCELGDPSGCYQLAHLLIDGKLPRDNKRAVELLEKTCDEFDRSAPGGRACSELVAIFGEGKLAKKDKALAAEYAQKYKNSQEGE